MCVYMVAGAGEGREESRMTPRFLEDGVAMTEMGRLQRSRLHGGCVWKQELSVGCFKFATPISHPGEMPGNGVSADLPAGQRWGSPPLLLPASHPEVGTVWAGDKSLLRE